MLTSLKRSILFYSWLIFGAAACNAQPTIVSSKNCPNMDKNNRPQLALCNKNETLEQLVTSKKLKRNQIDIFIRVFKNEAQLEIWAKNKGKNEAFVLLKSYEICAASGELGYKSMEGDNQVPEGVYFIDRFNPNSRFFLSLGLNYPNEADKIRNQKHGKPLGGDIFIHGDCKSIGCMAMTDDIIQEIYILALESFNAGQKQIPVHIFPCKNLDKKLANLQADFPIYATFWKNLVPIYTHFEKNKTLPKTQATANGEYEIK